MPDPPPVMTATRSCSRMNDCSLPPEAANADKSLTPALYPTLTRRCRRGVDNCPDRLRRSPYSTAFPPRAFVRGYKRGTGDRVTTKLTEAGRRIAREALAAPDDLSAIAQQTSIRESTLLDLVRAYLAEKAQTGPATAKTGVRNGAEIVRDRRGVPHIKADNPWDLFFGFGYAQAQDRLWQLDYLRRHAHGRLCEIFGGDRLTDDRLSRTLDISGIADRTAASLDDESALAQEAFAAGINAWMAQLPHGLPAEFEWLGYEPEPWQVRDSLAILRRWWWYLTGRLHVLWTPDVIRAQLDPALFTAYYTPDAEVGYIVPPGAY